MQLLLQTLPTFLYLTNINILGLKALVYNHLPQALRPYNCPGDQHQNAEGLSRMPILTVHPAKADRLYELIGYPSSWEYEPEATCMALQKLSGETIVRDNQLFKKVGSQYLPYVRPSLRVSLVL